MTNAYCFPRTLSGYNYKGKMNVKLLIRLIAFISTVMAEFSDLENFIRVIGSLDPNNEEINYINGSVFAMQPLKGLQKIFNFEGYNINRKIRQDDGSFLSLSREFCVYREPVTSQILQVWANPWTNKANEMFSVANDPVNAQLTSSSPWQTAPRLKPAYQIYNSDIILEYPNPLSPDKYGNYSAGQIYDAVELFGFFGNYSQLHNSNATSVPFVGTWIRKAQYLPWMVMSTTPGDLYFTAMDWKCRNGLSCVADDIMKLIKDNNPKFMHAPTTDEEPNETSWTVFKKVIDQRRQVGLPDIIIPEVNASSNVRVMDTSVDSRVLQVLYSWPLSLSGNGSAWSEIPGKQSVRLFDLRGFIQFDLERLPADAGYRVQLDGNIEYLDTKTGRPIEGNYTNPITGETIPPPKSELGVDYVFKKDSFYTIDIPDVQSVGLLGAQSTDINSTVWSVNFIEMVFPYSSLSKTPTSASFAGTFATFSSWPAWMKMADTPGNIVMKMTVSK